MSFKDWLEAVKRVMKLKSLYEPWPMKLPLPRNPSAFDFVRRCPLMYFGFCGSEPRHFVRACTQVVAPGTKVALDLTDLANDEIFEPDPNLFDHLFTDAAVEYARTTPVIVLTEGTSDTQILQKSLKVLYPHLEGFFSFMEFEGFKVPGGAGNLTNVVKAFAGSAVQNRIVAVFD
ncbi:MAG: hypothetical protein QOF78_4613, partial [Phycisphaerales bacterium]|nr:hypothetical protein [Phycisphaerales bacterium]